MIRIHAINDYVKEYCRDHVLFKQGEASEEFPVDFEVTVTQSDKKRLLYILICSIFNSERFC